ncbi:hypothetical protein GCM10010967_11940 [Dyadobacter beijingensis]|uniref:Uncharacterized protein n=1 Tax=Dyadobacter beijingensis TaxID=365489 RepID=A0ABQ2HIL3_9BACT|nr:hypothetical protein [Dyadobacter beijingensis]GGM81798.1 hypothetical protein GCM10010967_11940 [Dyadobacter beijingensis]
MPNLQRIAISSSPGYPDVVRQIVVVGRNEDYQNESVTLICMIEHFDGTGYRLNSFRAIEREPFLLMADNSSKVNPENGALVFPDQSGNYPEGSVGQYDWLKAAVENGANPFTIATGAVMEADALKRFN